jgi:N-acyl amino acid synthase of PEP-CTERM/exosortase system
MLSLAAGVAFVEGALKVMAQEGSRSPRHGRYEASAGAAAAYRTALELRYQVYCIECNFLSADDYPDGVETDEHDDDAAHFYAFDSRDELVGYVRLVRPDAEGSFPIQRHCRVGVVAGSLPPVSESAEISRLMVRSDYRRRRGDRLSGVTASQNREAFVGERRHQAPQILLSLYRQMYAYCREHGIRYWYAAMERPLARSLARLDFSFTAIGPETNYYGPVSPYVVDLRELERRVGRRRPELLEWLQRPERVSEIADHVADLGVCHIHPANAVLLREDRARHVT